MGFLRGIGHQAHRLFGRLGADARAAENWMSNHTVRPISHVVGSAGQLVGRAERFAGDQVKRLEHGIVTDEQALVGGVRHGLHAVENVVSGVGQVIGRAGHDVNALWTGAERAARWVPVVVAGGAVLWAVNQRAL